MYIVSPGSVNYTYLYQRPQQLMRGFGRAGYKGIYINIPALVDGATEIREPTKVAMNLTVVPPGYNLSKYKNSIMYYTYPLYKTTEQELDPSFTIFDSIDEPVGVFSHWNLDNIYEESVTEANLVLASAEKLYENAKKYNENTILVPNGCDFEHFSKAQKKPEQLEKIKGPIITFTGAVASWLDIELIYELARELPNCNIVLVGPLYDIQPTLHLDNIYHTGHQPYATLPSFLHHSDVLIIPFDVKNPVIEATNPIKYWEYLATGKPIVTTDIPEVKAPNVYKAKSSNEFIYTIKELTENPSMYTGALEGIQFAKENSWDVRVKTILEAMRKIK